MDAADGTTKLGKLVCETDGVDFLLDLLIFEGLNAILELSYANLGYGIGLDDLSILGDVLALKLFKIFEDGFHVGYEKSGGAAGLDGLRGGILSSGVREAGTEPDLTTCGRWHIDGSVGDESGY